MKYLDNSGLGHLWEKIKGLVGGKADVGHSHVSADIDDVDGAPTSGSGSLVTSGGVYGALSGKQAKVTGGASTITSSNLTANRALISNSVGKVGASVVTSTELGYLDGVTSNVQTQLNGKASTYVGKTNKVLVTDGDGKISTSTVRNDDFLLFVDIVEACFNFLNNLSEPKTEKFDLNVDINFKKTTTVNGSNVATADDISELAEEISGKQATIKGAASTITEVNVTPNRVLVSNIDGKVTASTLNSDNLQYLSGINDNVQNQLNRTAPKSHISTATTYGAGTSIYYGHVKLSDSTSSTSGTSSGIAATPSAVKAAYDLADTANTNATSALNKANIKKNTAITTGDIIDTHLTVGTRASGSTYYGTRSFAVGYNITASGENAFASGYYSKASGSCACAVCNSTASGNSSFSSGSNTSATGSCSFVTNQSNDASGTRSFAAGYSNTALDYQAKFGRWVKDGTAGTLSGTDGDVFTVGIGTSSAKKNGFRVDFAGNGYFYKAVSGTGADYAEMWEWQDGNPNSEDRVGYFVSFIGDKIRLANENDDLRKVGIISGNPAVVGDNFADDWQGMYLQDIYGRNITEHKSYDAEYDEDGNLIHEAYEADEYVLNPDYNSNEEYVPRRQRKEWDAVGTHGKLVVHDDGTCQVDGFCKPANGGIATASDTGFYVMERVNENHIRVYIR